MRVCESLKERGGEHRPGCTPPQRFKSASIISLLPKNTTIRRFKSMETSSNPRNIGLFLKTGSLASFMAVSCLSGALVGFLEGGGADARETAEAVQAVAVRLWRETESFVCRIFAYFGLDVNQEQRAALHWAWRQGQDAFERAVYGVAEEAENKKRESKNDDRKSE